MPKYNADDIPYFDVAFAEAGDLTPVPDAPSGTGSVSYTQGYTPPYSLAPSNPSAILVGRSQFNQIINDITLAIQYMQQNGAPPFITTAMNGGVTPYSYNLGAIVSYDGGAGVQNWISTEAANTTTPGAGGAFWSPIGSAANSRTLLTGATTFYVSPSGNDTNAGTSGAPWLTLQHAINYVQANIDLAGNALTIQAADTGGTPYTAGVVVSAPFTGGGTVTLQGNTVTPANCVVNTGSTAGGTLASCNNGSTLYISGFKFTGTGTNASAISCSVGGIIQIVGKMEYGAVSGAHINAQDEGSIVLVGPDYAISGGGIFHLAASYGGEIQLGSVNTVTLSGTPAFSGAFAAAELDGKILVSNTTFAGTGATGQRFIASGTGVINTNGAGANYFPGSIAGTGSNPGASPYGSYT